MLSSKQRTRKVTSGFVWFGVFLKGGEKKGKAGVARCPVVSNVSGTRITLQERAHTHSCAAKCNHTTPLLNILFLSVLFVFLFIATFIFGLLKLCSFNTIEK